MELVLRSIGGSLAGMLLLASGCLGTVAGTGCSKVLWNASVRQGEMETQFEIAYGTQIKIGFPGRLKFKGDVSGEHDQPELSPVIVPVPMPVPAE